MASEYAESLTKFIEELEKLNDLAKEVEGIKPEEKSRKVLYFCPVIWTEFSGKSDRKTTGIMPVLATFLYKNWKKILSEEKLYVPIKIDWCLYSTLRPSSLLLLTMVSFCQGHTL